MWLFSTTILINIFKSTVTFMCRFILITFCILFANQTIAQEFPKENDTLNYRLAGFCTQPMANAKHYLFEIADPALPQKQSLPAVILSKKSDTSRAVILLPSFDKEYMWRVKYLNKKSKVIKTTPFIRFRTGYYTTIDTNLYRMLIFDSATRDDIYLVMDYTTVIYNLKGEPVWYLPGINLVPDKNMQMRDVKPTHDGTFTATSHFGAYEFNYNGKKLWEAPNDGKVSGDTSEAYHHEFTKLKSGNYMVAAAQKKDMKIPSAYKIKQEFIESGLFTKRGDNYYREVPTDNLIEYNSSGEVVWYWKATEHFTEADFIRTRDYGANSLDVDMHLNSFFFDEENKVVYLSFRNMDEIVKIEYPSGKILKRYGAIWLNDSTKSDQRLFYGQHCIYKTPNGRIYLFNNNTNRKLMMDEKARENTPSHVCILEETATKTGMKKIFDFSCDIDTNAKKHGGAGGSVAVLADGAMLVNMGSAGRVFIVGEDKKIILNALPQSADANRNWYNLGQYRVNFINKTDIEKFIFSQ